MSLVRLHAVLLLAIPVFLSCSVVDRHHLPSNSHVDQMAAMEPSLDAGTGTEADAGRLTSGTDAGGATPDDAGLATDDGGPATEDDAGQPADDAGLATDDGGPATEDDAGQPADDAGQSADDAGQSADDAGQSADDAGQSADDAGQSADDAGQSADDAGQSADDAGQSADDAGQSADDAGQSADDAGQPVADAGPSMVDAGPSVADAGQPGDDAGQPGDDAGQPGDDAGQPGDDAGQPADDAGQPEDGLDGGAGDSGATQSCDPVTGCNVGIMQIGSFVIATAVPEEEPVATGGTIVPGTYVMTGLWVYTGVNGISATFSNNIHAATAVVQQVGDGLVLSMTDMLRGCAPYEQTLSLAPTAQTLTLSNICPAPTCESCGLVVPYSATPTSLTVFNSMQQGGFPDGVVRPLTVVLELQQPPQ